MDSKNKISKLLGALTLVLALTFSTSSYADNSDDSSGSSESSESSDSNGSSDSIPLDGGLSILLLGAAAFGVKKLRDTKK